MEKILQEIKEEREKQKKEYPKDSIHKNNELIAAAVYRAKEAVWPQSVNHEWRFPKWFSSKPKTTREKLIQAAALIVAEIERLENDN